MRWYELPRALAYAVKLIDSYLIEIGQLCFTYRGLRVYWLKRRGYEDFEWHTVERRVRELAEAGYVARVRKGKKVVFCVTEKWSELAGARSLDHEHQERSRESQR